MAISERKLTMSFGEKVHVKKILKKGEVVR